MRKGRRSEPDERLTSTFFEWAGALCDFLVQDHGFTGPTRIDQSVVKYLRYAKGDLVIEVSTEHVGEPVDVQLIRLDRDTPGHYDVDEAGRRSRAWLGAVLRTRGLAQPYLDRIRARNGAHYKRLKHTTMELEQANLGDTIDALKLSAPDVLAGDVAIIDTVSQ